MPTKKSSKVRVTEPQKCPRNCAIPRDATKQASTRTRTARKQKESSPILQKLDNMTKKSTKTGQTKPSKTSQDTKQAETSTKFSRNQTRTQPAKNTKKSTRTSESIENFVRKAESNNNNKPSESAVKKCYVLLHQLPEEVKTKPSKTPESTKQSPKLSRYKAQTQPTQNMKKSKKTSKSKNLERESQSKTVVRRCSILLDQLPEEVMDTKLAKDKQHMQKCDTLSKGVTRPELVGSQNLQNIVRKNVAFNDGISHKTKKSLPTSKLLRKRKTMNYAESSLEMSQDREKPQENRVPIYKLNVNKEPEPKQHEDTYEFDSSDTEKLPKKKKKRKLDDSSSDEYNKTINEILTKIATRVRKRKNGILPKKKQNNVIKAKPAPLKHKTLPQPNLDKDCNKNILKPVEKPTEDDDDDDDVDNSDFCFGFKENTPKIKILSDIHLKTNKEFNLSLATPTKFRESRPNANSTMINNVLTPWRFNDINIKRNPHFITLKESSLPCMSQEMVLDHTIVDKLGDHSKLDTTNRQDIRKTPVQKRVTDYFVCNSMNKINTEDKENLQVSLFDSDMFSPIKSSNQYTSKVESVKRKILGEKTDNNIVQVSTPIQNVSIVQSPTVDKSDDAVEKLVSNKENTSQNSNSNSKESDKDVNTYFGFDSTMESDDQITPKKNKNEKPFRLSVNVSDKKYTRKPKQTYKLPKRVEPVIESDDESDTSVQEDHNGEYRLFDDFDDTFEGDTIQEPEIIKKKRTRRRHLNDDGHHQRRKDMRTKEEEEEAEKWATAFNSLCEEIEEFPLEIE